MNNENRTKGIEEILVALRNQGKSVKETGQGKYICQCPAHDDGRPSLSLTLDRDRVLWHCFAGCSQEDVGKALGVLKIGYDYRDKSGRMINTKIRLPGKNFSFEKAGTEKVLYRLDELQSEKFIFIVDGEKDVDTLKIFGLIGTCPPCGCGSWNDSYAESLRDKVCYIIPDPDDAGRKGARKIANSLLKTAKEVRIVTLDMDMDVTDYFRSGKTELDLTKLVENTPKTKLDKAISLQPMSNVEDKPLVWFWNDKIPDHGLSMIQGDPGVSKSFLTTFIAAHISNGEAWPNCQNIPVKRGSVVIISGEDAPARIKERCRWHGADMDRIFVYNGTEQLDVRKHLAGLKVELDRLPDKCRLIIFDPITAYLGDTQANSNTEVRFALEPLSQFAEQEKLCIILINHMNKKAGEKHVYRGLGSMGFTAVCRSVWGVIWDGEDEDRLTRIFIPIKTNYSLSPSGLKYQITDNAVRFATEPFFGDIDEEAGKVKESRGQKLTDAREWLEGKLENGPVPQQKLETESELAGIKIGTLRRAKTELTVRATKDDTIGGQWVWEL